MKKQELIKEAFKLQQIAGIKPLYEFETNVQEIEDEEDVDVEDDWNKSDDEDDFSETEPTSKDLKVGDAVVGKLGSTQSKLQSLIQQKDAILNQFKSGQLTIDQYKQEIGNIPQQIKKLQADIESQMGGSEEEDDTINEKKHSKDESEKELQKETLLRNYIRQEVTKILKETKRK